MDKNTINSLRKTSSGLGFMLFSASTTIYTLSFIITLLFFNKIDNTLTLLMDIIVSITGLFIVGIFYCRLSSTELGSIIKVKWVKLSLAVPLVFAALAVSVSADYLTDIIQSCFSVFGVKNGVNLKTESHTLIENILNITAVSVIPPLVEEFLFRGILLGKLRQFGDSFALFMSSMLFALMHGNIIQIPFAFIVGTALAFVTIKSNSLLPAMAVHFLVNFRSVFLSVLTDNNIIAEDALNLIYIIIIAAVLVSGVISMAILSGKNNFFKLSRREDITFRQAVETSILSVGMMFFIINALITTIQTISVSWLNFNGLFS